MGERFAQFEEDTVPTFQPEVDQVYEGARRLRHKRRVRLVTAAVVLLAVPAVWVGLSQGENQAEPAGTPTYRVNVPGVTILDKPTVSFVDANVGFAMFSRCRVTEDPMCQHAAGLTTDRGRTWKSLRLPDIPADYMATIGPMNEREFVVTARTAFGEGGSWHMWLTRDAGATYTQIEEEPVEFMSAINGARLNYQVECPARHVIPQNGQGKARYEKDPTCTTKIVKRGAGPLDPQPADLGLLPWVLGGADGRVWLLTREKETDPYRVRVSDDEGKTWDSLPDIPKDAHLSLSPDGTEVYYVDVPGSSGYAPVREVPGTIARLAEGKWVKQFEIPKADSHAWISALGDGSLLVSAQEGMSISPYWFFLKDGVRSELPIAMPLTDTVAQVLSDGTLVLDFDGKGVYVAVGRGIDREWTFITY